MPDISVGTIVKANPSGSSQTDWLLKEYRGGPFTVEEVDGERVSLRTTEGDIILDRMKRRRVEWFNVSDLVAL